jgi:hypothetical protein
MKFRRGPLPPPERLTAADVLHIVMALMMIPLGATILVRTAAVAITLQGVVVGGAFVAFGVYRLWLAWSRLRMLRHNGRGTA